MTTATKAAPVKAPAAPAATPAAPKATRTPLVPVDDWSSVAIAEGGVVKQDRKSALDGTPVRDWVKSVRANGNKIMTVSCKTGAVETLKSLIQRAATEIGCGVRFGKPVAVADKPGYSALAFKTADKKELDSSPEAVAARKAKRDAAKLAKAAK